LRAGVCCKLSIVAFPILPTVKNEDDQNVVAFDQINYDVGAVRMKADG
jgi:peptidyl-tRNA hydrolase